MLNYLVNMYSSYYYKPINLTTQIFILYLTSKKIHYDKLDEILYIMNALEDIKKYYNQEIIARKWKNNILTENCIDEKIGRSEALQNKINKNKGNNELKITSILSLITYSIISKHSKTGYYNYDKTSKRNINIYKYSVIYLREFMLHVLFLKKEIEKATGLNGVFSFSNTFTAELLKLYFEDIEFQKEYKFEFLDCLKEGKQNTRTKYITDYKYSTKTKSSIWPVKK